MYDLTRKTVRHLLFRRRNERIAETRDGSWPRTIRMCQVTIEELVLDPDPGEAQTLEYLTTGAYVLCGIPVLIDPRLAPGVLELDWPAAPAATAEVTL